MHTWLHHDEHGSQPGSSRIFAQLHHRRQAIALHWLHAIARLDVRHISTARLLELLSGLTDQIIIWLCAPAHQQIQAKAIGKQLAKISNFHPEALGVTLQVWSKQLSTDLSHDDTIALQARLAALFSELTAGFVVELHDLLQAEQQQARSALATAQRQIYQVFQETKHELRLVMSHTPVIVAAIDRAGKLTRLEGKGLHALKLTSGEITGKSIFEVAAELPSLLEHIRRALAGKPCTNSIKLRHLVFEARYEPVKDESGLVEGVICIAFAAAKTRRSSHSRAELPHAEPPPKAHATTSELNAAELEVVQLLIQGCTNQQIAATLSLSKQGIAKRLEKLYLKLNVSNRTQAVAHLARLGLIDGVAQNPVGV